MPTKKLITPEDLYELQAVEDPQISPDGKQIAFVKVTVDKLGNKYSRNIWLATVGSGMPRVRQFTFGAKADTAPRWSPDGQTLAFVSARNGKPQIYLIGLDGGEARPLTSMPNGANNPVWSPDGERMAFLAEMNAEERVQEDENKDEPAPATALEAKHKQEREDEKEKAKTDPRVISQFPYRTGTEYYDDRTSHIYVIDVPAVDEKPDKAYRLTDGELDFGSIAWAADGRAIYSTQSRTPEYSPWEHSDVVRLAVVGKRKPYKTLTQAGHEYVGPVVSPDGKWLAVGRRLEDASLGTMTELAVIPTSGGEPRDLTVAFDRGVDFDNPRPIIWAADSRSIYFQSADSGAVGVYRVKVTGGAVEKIVGGRRAVASFSVSRAGRVAFTAFTPERLVDVYIAETGGKSEKRLTNFNAKFLAEREIVKIEELRYPAEDGYAIQGWLLKPPGFRKGQKVPLVVNMHGGPWVMWGPNAASMWLEWQVQAARGYAVFFCNPRGSSGYGEAHATVIRNSWHEPAMGDILTGVDVVTSQGFVDVKRMALTGGSYAGYMTAWIIGHDSRFACAWSQRGLYNFLSWYGTTDIPYLFEREFEMYPWEDALTAWEHSPLAYVENIHTPLALEHQDNDWRCPPADAEQLYTALKRLKRMVVMYRYPREGHEMSRGGEPMHRIDRLNRMCEWFDKYCKKSRK